MTTAADLIHAQDALLLDFDGPVCSVFSGYPAPRVAEKLRQQLAEKGHVSPSSLPSTDDPLEVLRWTASNHPILTPETEDFLTAEEKVAVRSARPAEHAHAAMAMAKRAGCPVAIVSNNSEGAIREYLANHGIEMHVSAVLGRPYAAPELMKPNPVNIFRAAEALHVSLGACTFIGDSPTDVEASILAGVKFVGYARRPDRISTLRNAGAQTVVESMGVIAEAMAALCPRQV